MPVIKSKVIRVKDADGIWHDLPATVSEESFRAAERAAESAESAAQSAATAEEAIESISQMPVEEARAAAAEAAESAQQAVSTAQSAVTAAAGAVQTANAAKNTANAAETKADNAVQTASAAAVAAMPDVVTTWLGENISPADPPVVIDTSLLVTGAAADAKATGDTIADMKSIASLKKVRLYNTWKRYATDNYPLGWKCLILE